MGKPESQSDYASRIQCSMQSTSSNQMVTGQGSEPCGVADMDDTARGPA
jgi:hypothetical protein